MKIKAFFAALLLSLTVPASAFETVSLAYELALSDVAMPSTQNSVMRFQECDDCDWKTIRVTSDTRYVVNGRNVRFERFRTAVDAAGNRDRVPVIVLHHLESDTVVSISVSLK